MRVKTYTPSDEALDVAHRAVADLSVSDWDEMSETARNRARALVSAVVASLAADIDTRVRADAWDEGVAYVNAPFGIEPGMRNPYMDQEPAQ